MVNLREEGSVISGYWGLSRIQQTDLNGRPLPGALAYFYQAGTTTPMVVYQDASFALPHPNPVEANGLGRFPGVFFDETSFSFFKMRVTDAEGSLIFEDDSVPIIGQVATGDTPPPPVDQNGLFDTGELLFSYSTGSRPGFVRANGRNVGSATSGATERANADTQALFEHLWAKDANLAVSGGRGVSAAADWAANKTITLPDFRGRSPFGLDDMGNSAAARIAAGYVDAPYTPIVLGGSGGDDAIALATAELPAHTHTDGSLAAAAHTHLVAANATSAAALTGSNQIADFGSIGDFQTYALAGSATAATEGKTSSTGPVDVAGDTGSTGGGTGHENMPPFQLVTVYIRL